MWREIGFVVALEQVEAWSDALLEAGASSVQAEDADADSIDEQAIFGEPGLSQPARLGWQRTRLTALQPAQADAQSLLNTAAALLEAQAPLDFSTRVFADEDWVRLTQSQFEPIRISPRLLITPTWHLDRIRSESMVHAAPEQSVSSTSASTPITIVLDPGLAFGTGSHPTTRLCLQWLDAHLRPGQTVLDYGCGSGILAIAAAKLGASSVQAIDIDEQAVRSTHENAQTNRVAVEVRSTRDAPPLPADVVVANILATPLKLLAPLLESLVLPNGYLILAGLLERQISEVAARYVQIDMRSWQVNDGWACLVGQRTNTAL